MYNLAKDDALLRSHLLLNALEVVNAVPGRDRRVIPAVVHDQLAATRDKLAQIGVRRIQLGPGRCDRLFQRLIDVRRQHIPLRIAAHHIAEIIPHIAVTIRRSRPLTNNPVAPAILVAQYKSWEDRFPLRVDASLIQLLQRVHLQLRQALDRIPRPCTTIPADRNGICAGSLMMSSFTPS